MPCNTYAALSLALLVFSCYIHQLNTSGISTTPRLEKKHTYLLYSGARMEREGWGGGAKGRQGGLVGVRLIYERLEN